VLYTASSVCWSSVQQACCCTGGPHGLTDPLRRFVFANWLAEGDQKRDAQGARRGDATLELRALRFSIRENIVTSPCG
jgi:hypothetical protein